MTIQIIDVAGLAEKLPGAVLIDVREPDEYAEGRVPGAKLVPLATVPQHVDELPTDQPVYFICKMGGRSQQAAEFAAQHGVQAVNVAGGTVAWIEAGKPVEQ
ncbi:rhodanese-like domain-containing protein [Granulicoccus phenolivorans]|uniref:rhodanese-like domain-containing protein n=1 Tax=Granulicoccus phenolivorans TaxID=266854 RepID=UPI00042A7EAA|nr:rhodanese-like domain-containing protein [Granulicoccus phenolivorans]